VAGVFRSFPVFDRKQMAEAAGSEWLAGDVLMAFNTEIMTGNPALNQNTFTDVQSAREGATMTIQGTVDKTSILLVLVVVAASFTWRMYFAGEGDAVMPWTFGGAIGGFVIGLVTTFKKVWSPVTSPLYAICEGLFIGGFSSILEAHYPGIVLQAVMLTFGTLAALLFAYKTGLIVASDKFKRGVIAATGGVMLVYVATLILGFFGVQVPFVYGSSLMSIGFSIVVVIIAALNLVIDFDFIETGAQAGVPKYLEWYAAFGLLVTLVWLYLEIIRLLTKINRRN
jgi:uncharacterized YccA/Bax inhibitor family protein